MRLVQRLTMAAGAGCAAAALVGCGSSGSLLSRGQAQVLDAQLHSVAADLGAGDCVRARTALGALRAEVDGLQGVNGNLTSNLAQGVDTIQTLSETTCPTTKTVTTTTTRSRATTTQTSSSVVSTTTATSSTMTTSAVTTSSTVTGPTTTSPGQGTSTSPTGGGGL